MSYTADALTYSPDPPHYYGMVQFEGGGRMMADFTDIDDGKVEVGMPMRMMFRSQGDRSGARLRAILLEGCAGLIGRGERSLQWLPESATKVVVLGMGCSKFGERWDQNAEDLMVEAFEEGLKDAGHRAQPDRGRVVSAPRSRSSTSGSRRAARDDAAPARTSR
jgi:hypothetical protein